MCAFGIFLALKLRLFFLLHPLRTARVLLGAMRKKGAVRALFLALAGTLGVGNIAGVAFGIAVGGAGSVLWMLVSAVFAAVIKYCESALAADMRDGSHGGMMYVIKSSFKSLGKPLSVLYASLCLLLSLVMGAALQTKTVVAAFEELGFSPLVCAVSFTALVMLAITRGSEKIDKITVYIIPLTTLAYIFLSFFVIFKNYARIPEVLSDIIGSAFSAPSILGGAVGALSSRAVSEGFSRGLLSNEAGIGTSSLAEARASNSSPAECGLLGMCEVIFDTVLLCTLTALSVLLSMPEGAASMSGMQLVISAFSSSVGALAAPLLTLLVLAFAYSTVICWYFYGSECVRFLFKSDRKTVQLFFCLLFTLSLSLSFSFSEASLIFLTDLIMLPMAALTLISLTKNSERALHLSEHYGLIKSKKPDVRLR